MIGLGSSGRLSLGAPGAFGASDFICPAGQTRNFNADTGETWCEDAAGKHFPATEIGAQKSSIGVFGWGAILAGGLILLSWVLPQMGFRMKTRPNRRRRRRLLPRYISR
jgi:hypothetical protein